MLYLAYELPSVLDGGHILKAGCQARLLGRPWHERAGQSSWLWPVMRLMAAACHDRHVMPRSDMTDHGRAWLALAAHVIASVIDRLIDRVIDRALTE